jgi:hypothetical protein
MIRPGVRAGGSSAPDGAPSNATLIVLSGTVIQVNFDIGSTNHDGHRIYISTDGVTFTENSTVLGAVATKQVTGLTAATQYWLYVVAYKGVIESVASNVVTDTTDALPGNILLNNDGTPITNYDGSYIYTN